VFDSAKALLISLWALIFLGIYTPEKDERLARAFSEFHPEITFLITVRNRCLIGQGPVKRRNAKDRRTPFHTRPDGQAFQAVSLG
jgi:hypothetical protein